MRAGDLTGSQGNREIEKCVNDYLESEGAVLTGPRAISDWRDHIPLGDIRQLIYNLRPSPSKTD